jgi:hypothetical protein
MSGKINSCWGEVGSPLRNAVIANRKYLKHFMKLHPNGASITEAFFWAGTRGYMSGWEAALKSKKKGKRAS